MSPQPDCRCSHDTGDCRSWLSQNTNAPQDVYKALGDTVNQTKLEHMRSQMAGFKEKLEEFAIKHRCLLACDAAFLHELHVDSASSQAHSDLYICEVNQQ